MQNQEYEVAIEVADEIMLYHDDDKRLLQLVSDIYIKNMDDSKAVKYLEKLMKMVWNLNLILMEVNTILHLKKLLIFKELLVQI